MYSVQDSDEVNQRDNKCKSQQSHTTTPHNVSKSFLDRLLSPSPFLHRSSSSFSPIIMQGRTTRAKNAALGGIGYCFFFFGPIITTTRITKANEHQSTFNTMAKERMHTSFRLATFLFQRRISSLSFTIPFCVPPKTDWCARVIKALRTEPFTFGNGTERRFQTFQMPWRVALERIYQT